MAPACGGVKLHMKPVGEHGGSSVHPGVGQPVKNHWPDWSRQENSQSGRNVFWPEPRAMVSAVSSSGGICVVR